jgi:hypothetical protein
MLKLRIWLYGCMWLNKFRINWMAMMELLHLTLKCRNAMKAMCSKEAQRNSTAINAKSNTSQRVLSTITKAMMRTTGIVALIICPLLLESPMKTKNKSSEELMPCRLSFKKVVIEILKQKFLLDHGLSLKSENLS